jgi:hypothetical protein
VFVDANGVIRGCTARNNGTTADHFEIVANSRSRVEDCLADGWTGTVVGPGHGIRIAANSTVRNCTSQNNGGSGFIVVSPDNRIESNHAIANTGPGFDVDAPNNVIILNSARANTPDFDIVAGNQYSVGAPVAGATNPFSNIDY